MPVILTIAMRRADEDADDRDSFDREQMTQRLYIEWGQHQARNLMHNCAIDPTASAEWEDEETRRQGWTIELCAAHLINEEVDLGELMTALNNLAEDFDNGEEMRKCQLDD